MVMEMAKKKIMEHDQRWQEVYFPCDNGVHVFDSDGEFGGVTVQNFPNKDLAVFRELSSAGEGDDFDLICDLFVAGEIIDNITIRRQDLALIERQMTTSDRKNT